MEHSFSVEMKSRKHVRQMVISRDGDDHVLFEGNLGKLESLAMIENAVLVIHGSNGIMRIDLSENELKRVIPEKKGKEHR
jgi:hypothetical protein